MEVDLYSVVLSDVLYSVLDTLYGGILEHSRHHCGLGPELNTSFRVLEQWVTAPQPKMSTVHVGGSGSRYS